MIRLSVKIRKDTVSPCAQAVGMHSFTTAFLHSISDLHLNSESSDYLHVRSGPMVSLSYKQADPSYTVDSDTRVTFPVAVCDKSGKHPV